MRIFLSMLVVLMGICGQVYAQPDSLWSRFYGGDSSEVLRGVQVLEDSSLIMVGRCDSWGAGGADYWLLKTTADGDSLWSRFYGGTAGDFPSGLKVTSDGGFLIYGGTGSFGSGNGDFWLIKTDANGDSLWTRTFGGPNPEQTRSGGQTTDGGYYVAGYTQSFGAGTEDFWLVRVSANGDSLWSRTFGGASNERCFTSIVGSDGNIYMAGDARSYGAGDKNVWLVAASPDGDSLWSRVFGGEYDEECRAIQQAADGGFWIIGGKNMDGADLWNVWVIRTDSNGNELWNRAYGGDANGFGADAKILPDGGLALCGDSPSFGAGDDDFWLLRLDANGDSLWSGIFGSDSEEVFWTMAIAPDGGYYLAGRSGAWGPSSDWWLLRTSPDPLTNEREHQIFHPSSFALSAYPNPFNPLTTICFVLPVAQHVALEVYDLNGRQVMMVAAGMYAAGSHAFRFNATDLPSGIFFARLFASNHMLTQRLILLK